MGKLRAKDITMRKASIIVVTMLLFAVFSCQQERSFEVTSYLSDSPIIPLPVNVISDSSYLVLGNQLYFDSEGVSTQQVQAQMSDFWKDQNFATEDLRIQFTRKESLAEEAYDLAIHADHIRITANDSLGFLWGWMTLKQVIALSSVETEYGTAIPTGIIEDQPKYGYRGMMLDIARHFFSPEEIKTIIDEISMYKINRLHLHLADDQGWRIEIKSWPKLTEIGGSVEVGSSLEVDDRQGGFLTQDDYIDLVNYAAQNGMMIIPEIDMPGHTNAALASYPELNCDGLARELYTGTEVGFSTLCTDKEITYKFIDDVVREIGEITPGPYFHIGGDESHSTEHDDYLYFINRVISIVENNGKTMIGWDESAEADVRDGTVVQLWAHPDMAEMGLSKGATILFSLSNKTYIDMKYDSTTNLGLSWAGYIDVPTSYNWDPTDYISEEYADQFLGLESPLWTETVTNVKEAEYMIFPRITSYAEIGWTPKESRSWEDFLGRLRAHENWWNKLEINSYKEY